MSVSTPSWSRRRSARVLSAVAASAAIAGLLVAPAAVPGHAVPVIQPAQEGLLINGPNAVVTAVAHDAGSQTTYVAGDFTRWGPQTGGMGIVSQAKDGQSTGALNTSFPAVLGTVRVAIPDGVGGIYIGGSFTHVDGLLRNNAAHILANGRVDENWDPNPVDNNADDGVDGVYDMARVGSDVILAGRFAMGGEQNRGITRVGPDGQPVWAGPSVNEGGGLVKKIAVTDDTIYAGGEFAQLGGDSRVRAGAVSLATGIVQSWNPRAGGGTVNAVEILDGQVVLGGAFTSVSSNFAFQRLAAVGIDGTLNTGWDPNATGAVTALEAVEGAADPAADGLYVSGQFTSIAGATRYRAAQLEPDLDSAAAATDWDPGLDAAAVSLQEYDGRIYLAGPIAEVGGAPAPGFAAVFTGGTGTRDTSWDPPESAFDTDGITPDENTTAAPLGGGLVVLGGSFTVLGGTSVGQVAALDADGGLITTFDVGAGPDARVNAMAVGNGLLYLGGEFETFAGEARGRLAAVDLGTGALDSWGDSAGANAGVDALAFLADRVYVGGQFTQIGGQNRTALAALDTVSQQVTPWAASAISATGSPRVMALQAREFVGEPEVFIGGEFTRASGGGVNLAKLSGLNGDLVLPFPQATGGGVRGLSRTDGRLFAVGDFTDLGGDPATGVAAVELSDNSRASWDGGTLQPARAVSASSDQVIVGGAFDSAFGGYTTGLGAAAQDTAATPYPWSARAVDVERSVRVLQIIREMDTDAENQVAIGADGPMLVGRKTYLFFALANSPVMPGPAPIISATRGGAGGTVDLTWEPLPSFFDTSTVVGYRIQQSGPPYTTWQIAVGNTDAGWDERTYTVEGLTNNQRVRFRVAALVDRGTGSYAVGAWSPPSNWAMPADPTRLPGAPQNVTAQGIPVGTIRVQGDAPESWGTNAGPKGYRALAQVDAIPMGFCQNLPDGGGVPPAALDCTITDLTQGLDYQVQARAFNTLNQLGPWASAPGLVSAASIAPPPTPEPTDPPVPSPTTTPRPVIPLTPTKPRRATATTVGALRVRAVSPRKRKGHLVVVRTTVSPARGREVQLQRKLCTKSATQRSCAWRTVSRTRAANRSVAMVTLRSRKALRSREVWRVFVPATPTAAATVSRTVRR